MSQKNFYTTDHFSMIIEYGQYYFTKNGRLGVVLQLWAIKKLRCKIYGFIKT